MGKRLLEPQSKYRELNDLSANEYLDKAEKLFREMDLEWDLEQLEGVRTELEDFRATYFISRASFFHFGEKAINLRSAKELR